MQVSRGKPDRLHRTPARFTAVTLGGYGFRYLLLAHPITPASYLVSVRQVAVLLHALRSVQTPPRGDALALR